MTICAPSGELEVRQLLTEGSVICDSCEYARPVNESARNDRRSKPTGKRSEEVVHHDTDVWHGLGLFADTHSGSSGRPLLLGCKLSMALPLLARTSRDFF